MGHLDAVAGLFSVGAIGVLLLGVAIAANKHDSKAKKLPKGDLTKTDTTSRLD